MILGWGGRKKSKFKEISKSNLQTGASAHCPGARLWRSPAAALTQVKPRGVDNSHRLFVIGPAAAGLADTAVLRRELTRIGWGKRENEPF
jgi:hypothetical protein